jgi:hypothetical protein
LVAALTAAEPEPNPGIPLFPAELARPLLTEAAGLITAGPESMPDLVGLLPNVVGALEVAGAPTTPIPGSEPELVAGPQATVVPAPPRAPAPCSPQLPTSVPPAGEPLALLEPAAPARVPLAAAVDA